MGLYAITKIKKSKASKILIKQFKEPLTSNKEKDQETGAANKYQQYLDFIQNTSVQTDSKTIAYAAAVSQTEI